MKGYSPLQASQTSSLLQLLMTQSKSRLCWRACCALALAYGGYFEACVDHGVCQSLIEDDKDTSQLISAAS